MHEDILNLIICPECGGSHLVLRPYSSQDGDIIDGAILCSSCDSWFRIEGGILDLLPKRLWDVSRYIQFAERYNLPATMHPQRPTDNNTVRQMRFFSDHSNEYEKDVVQSPYYQALNHTTLMKWLDRSRLHSGDWVLELGCGTGSQSILIAQRNVRYLGLDIAEPMVLKAREKVLDLKIGQKADFIIGDAGNPPFKEEVFSACVICGSLIHFSRPDQVVMKVARILRKGGLFFSVDPQESPLRFLFNILMKIRTLYHKEEGEVPLMSRSLLGDWLYKAGIQGSMRVSTYLPPHLLNLMIIERAEKVLEATDAFFGSLPGIWSWGGMIITEGRKN